MNDIGTDQTASMSRLSGFLESKAHLIPVISDSSPEPVHKILIFSASMKSYQYLNLKKDNAAL